MHTFILMFVIFVADLLDKVLQINTRIIIYQQKFELGRLIQSILYLAKAITLSKRFNTFEILQIFVYFQISEVHEQAPNLHLLNFLN